MIGQHSEGALHLHCITSNDHISINNRLPSPPKQSHFVMQQPSSDTSLPTGSGNYKRLKPLPVSTSPANINDLSAESCCIIADFLPKTSRALLAVALTAPPSSFQKSGWKGEPSAVSKAIILCTKADLPFSSVLDGLCEEARVEAEARGKERELKLPVGSYLRKHLLRKHLTDQIREYYCNGDSWNVLDFVDLPMSLATRLSDDDVGAILVCIDAKHKLEHLTLTHCTNVIGHGLEPLRSSTRLQALNLGLVRKIEKPFWEGERDEFVFDDAKLSEGPVCGIIDGILGEEGNALKCLKYPYIWTDDSSVPNASEPMFVFQSERMKQLVDEHGAFANKFACCVYFGYDFEGMSSFLRSSNWPEQVDDCQDCCFYNFHGVCSDCNDIICHECYCDDADTGECEQCKTFHCPRCIRYGGADEIKLCEDCDQYTCSSCRLTGCKNGSNDCTTCRSEMFDELLDECNSKQVQIDSQNDELER